MFSVFNIAATALIIILVWVLYRACNTNNLLRKRLYEQRSAVAMATEVRTDRAYARIARRQSAFAVLLSDSNSPYWMGEILIKEFRFDGDEDYAHLLAEELCDKINEEPYPSQFHIL